MVDLVRWKPLHGLMRDFFDDITPFFGRSLIEEADFMPRLDIRETDTAVEVSMDLPGMEKKEIDVSLDGDILRITGERKRDRREKENGYTYHERSYGRFERCIRLPESVDGGRITASYDDGVLTVTAPKRKGEKAGRKKIAVK